MSNKQAGFVPLILIIPAVLAIFVGISATAYYYSQNKAQTASEQTTKVTTPSQIDSTPTPLSATPLPQDTPLPSPLPLKTPEASAEAITITVKDASESGDLAPKCGIIFETGFNVFVEQSDNASTIAQKAIDQYLAAVPRLSAARDNSIFYLTTEQRKVAGSSLAASLGNGKIASGQKITFSCTEVEKACLQASKGTKPN